LQMLVFFSYNFLSDPKANYSKIFWHFNQHSYFY